MSSRQYRPRASATQQTSAAAARAADAAHTRCPATARPAARVASSMPAVAGRGPDTWPSRARHRQIHVSLPRVPASGPDRVRSTPPCARAHGTRTRLPCRRADPVPIAGRSAARAVCLHASLLCWLVGCAKDPRHCCSKVSPQPGARFQFASPFARELVVLGAPILLAHPPLRIDPRLLLESVEGGIQRPFLDAQCFAAELLDPAANAVAMHRSPAQSLEDHDLECAVQQFLLHRVLP